MDKQKPNVTIVANTERDAAIISLLGYNYNVNNVLTLEEIVAQMEQNYARDRRRSYNLPTIDFILLNEESIQVFSKYFSVMRDLNMRMTKVIAFGKAAIELGALNGATVLRDITNHNKTEHLTTFCMSDDRLLDFNVRSNHTELLFPMPDSNFEILAFSTHNLSDSYTDVFSDTTFKAKKNFLEIEGIHFTPNNSFCFMYDPPQRGESVLIDLTLQFLK